MHGYGFTHFNDHDTLRARDRMARETWTISTSADFPLMQCVTIEEKIRIWLGFGGSRSHRTVLSKVASATSAEKSSPRN